MVNACEYTNWTFVRVNTDENVYGVGEATMGGSENLLRAAVAEFSSAYAGRDAGAIRLLTRLDPGAPGGRIHYAVLSAIEQALWDLAGKVQGVPVYRLLGGAGRESVPLYANLNRGIRDRSPEGFAAQARAAAAAGFPAMKVTPFDGVQPGDMADVAGRRRLGLGVERVFAAREAVGPDFLLMVDCHWRFTAAEAVQVAAELVPARLFWIEDMCADDDMAAWQRFRQLRPERVAGGERQVGLRGCAPYLQAGVWDVVCPDVKYCGGVAELQHIASLAGALGKQVAPHNPSGPVATLASAHAAAALDNLAFVEYAFGECTWRSGLVDGAEQVQQGRLMLPESPGLGFAFDEDLLAAHPYQPVIPLAARIGLPWT